MNDGAAKLAVYWDKSGLWGLIAYRTFSRLGIDFELLSSDDVRSGGLEDRDVLFVPGGWASDKIVALGDEGAAAIRDFVGSGGGYLGFCGGAGLALSHGSGLGLAPFGRLPTSKRLPSFSGGIILRHESPSHAIWQDVAAETPFCAWWPGQFALEGAAGVQVLASYGEPQPGSFVTDLPVAAGFDWAQWEELYGINLDPVRLTGEPAVAEVAYGSGKVILSYLHFETPGDNEGHKVLLNLIGYLSGGKQSTVAALAGAKQAPVAAPPEGEAATTASGLHQMVSEFIDFGQSNFLWYWRSDWLLQWRRGVRGIEYSALYGMLAELNRLAVIYGTGLDDAATASIEDLKVKVVAFLDDAHSLILKERLAMTRGPVSPLKSDDAEVSTLRERLFSSTKRCGGLYEEIMDLAELILLPMLRHERSEASPGGAAV